jgi:hypothetical protein
MASKSYSERLKIPLEGDETLQLYTKSGTKVATGYERVVLGGRGPYVEFRADQIVEENFEIPEDQEYRKTDKRVYYIEARSKDDSYVKLYIQKRTVAYADYKVGMLYISPFELKTDEFDELVEPLEKD